MRNYILLFFIGVGIFSCTNKKEVSVSDLALIPKPQKVEIQKGNFKLDKSSTLYAAEEFAIASDFFQDYLKNGTGFQLVKASKDEASIVLEKDASQAKEGYSFLVSKKKIIVKASDASGAFYAIQTLRQLLPYSMEGSEKSFQVPILVQSVSIQDAPKFQYRGMHLDVGRHFFPKEFIKKYISSMALLKMNYFHWHLTEDQGWRIEIKKYPKLTSHAAFRDETLIGHYSDQPQQYDGTRYGGFYTQEDIKEIVAFAEKHNVTIIPEIEMPGHAQAAISAYPELGCTGKEVPVATTWGVFENIYCPNQKTFAFLEDVLTEVIDLFPGEYIHIGGDEAPKSQWKKCAHCQKLIKEHDLKDEHGLQSYFIQRMEKFLNSKGKKIIGWDEILEGGLAPNATVMSWRGMEGGIEAAKAKHSVIMTPTSHAYFDYYQSDSPAEPLAIGGLLPLKKVYSFNPIPEELTKDEASFILGAQGNIWTEYMKTEAQVEYMAFPRMLAMSEVVWNGASTNVEEDYSEFLLRLEPFLDRLKALDINYANHLYKLEGKVIKENGGVYYQLKTPIVGKDIFYQLNNGISTKYTAPFSITESSSIQSQVTKNGVVLGESFTDTIVFHQAITGSLQLNIAPNKAYDAGGKEALINGINGSDKRYGDKEWLGFWGDNVEITIDLGEPKEIRFFKTRFYNATGQWIYAPKEIEIFASEDNVSYGLLKRIQLDNTERIVEVTSEIYPTKKQFIKIRIPNYGMIPEGKQGAGNKAWTFIDELIFE
ncbi:family 20 glycosylhydrolase [Candidatus Marifrigoribacter sp. Uisw_064]|uniref:glycoside hydrolase family 20 protein n=1 Tax=Candidatus Marifrigoribacter sp. Uisw_064 TaxID=3230970 RepID=UPI003D375293